MIEAHFSDLIDTRVEWTKRHRLLDILVIAIGAAIYGGDAFWAMADFVSEQ